MPRQGTREASESVVYCRKQEEQRGSVSGLRLSQLERTVLPCMRSCGVRRIEVGYWRVRKEGGGVNAGSFVHGVMGTAGLLRRSGTCAHGWIVVLRQTPRLLESDGVEDGAMHRRTASPPCPGRHAPCQDIVNVGLTRAWAWAWASGLARVGSVRPCRETSHATFCVRCAPPIRTRLSIAGRIRSDPLLSHPILAGRG